MKLSEAEVRGAATFYHFFSLAPARRARRSTSTTPSPRG
ncbi:MAG: NAD(P)H-dependent oxidoreductase subunit E [Candidatus Moduliflexus flocculans]|nr:NAD(P)H-dependent oxidoreductase subunit E [Candidatus Moduliflexus flocculans]